MDSYSDATHKALTTPSSACAGQLVVIRQEFEAVFNRCPEEAMGRQKIIEERRNGHVYVQIITSFKLTAT